MSLVNQIPPFLSFGFAILDKFSHNRRIREAPLRKLLTLMLFGFTACSLSSFGFTQDVDDEDITKPDAYEFLDTSDQEDPVIGIHRVVPARGPTTGGTEVEIQGFGFAAHSLVVFGSSKATNVVVQNDHSILATTPANQSGFVSVAVVQPDNTVLRQDKAFFYETDVSIFGVKPDKGPETGGTPVTITGYGFTQNTSFIIGGRLVFDARVLDEQTAVAVTPPSSAGPKDVMAVSEGGTGRLRRGFSYLATPSTPKCFPAVVPVGQETLVFATAVPPVDLVLATPGKAANITSLQDFANFELTATQAGPIEVTLSGPAGVATNSSCLWATDKDIRTGNLEILGFSPGVVPESGGMPGVLGVIGIQAGVRVEIGKTNAEIVSIDPEAGYIEVVIPPHEPGVVACTVASGTRTVTLQNCLRYVPDMAIDEVFPSEGPATGGTRVLLKGKGLGQVSQVNVGPLPATIVAGPSNSAIEVVTSAGSPGRHDVIAIASDGRRAVLPKSFSYGSNDVALIAITPDSGAIAGGTIVSLVGSGFAPGCRVEFGSMPAEIIDDFDPARLLVRTPMQEEPGQYDVSVRFPNGHLKTLREGFTYFDPTGIFGGVWGESIDGAVNVTVKDGSTGKPLVGAFVLIGPDDEAQYFGRTNLTGQLTLSGPDLVGPIQITATREDYTTFSIVGVDAENITLYIDSILPPPDTGSGSGSGSDPLPPGLVKGKVTGIEKNLLMPADSCVNQQLIHGPLCRPCSSDLDCDYAKCVPFSQGGFFCATDCVSDDDCPDGYSCFASFGAGLVCKPSTGRVEIRCNTTLSGAYSYPPTQGPGALVGPQRSYVVNSRLGTVGVQCEGGVRHFSDGNFEPMVFGLTLPITVYPARITEDQDVDLNIHLDRDLKVRFVNAPGGIDGPNDHSLMAAIELGVAGALRPWPVMGGYDLNHYHLNKLPREFKGPLETAKMMFMGEANSRVPGGMPYSVSRVSDWLPGKKDTVALIGANYGTVLAQEVRPEVYAACPVAEGSLLFGPNGRTWLIDHDKKVSQMPSAASSTLYACTNYGESIFAVGDGGVITRLEAGVWQREAVPTAKTLMAIAFDHDGTGWAGGDGILLRRASDGTWIETPYGSNQAIRSLISIPGGGLIGFGDKGLVIKIAAETASPLLPFPGNKDLLTAVIAGDQIVVAGAQGGAYIGPWMGPFNPIPISTFVDITALTVTDDGSIYAAGSLGHVFVFDGTQWSKIEITGFNSEITVLIPTEDGEILVLASDDLAIGPFLGIAKYQSPIVNSPWLDRTIEWSFDRLPTPSFTYMGLYGSKAKSAWVVVGPGHIQKVRLPDLSVKGGPELKAPLPGSVRIRAYHVLNNAFDINRFDNASLYSSSWRSWVIQQVEALFLD